MSKEEKREVFEKMLKMFQQHFEKGIIIANFGETKFLTSIQADTFIDFANLIVHACKHVATVNNLPLNQVLTDLINLLLWLILNDQQFITTIDDVKPQIYKLGDER